MTELQFHPLADLFPLMEGAEFDALVADIKANGLREKIDLYKGSIVEGRNRYRALQRLGINPEREPKKYFRKAIYTHTIGGEVASHEQNNDDRVRAYVISKNIHRRHLTAEQRRELIAKLIKAEPGKSDRQVAKQAKVDHKTVGVARAELEATGEIPQLKKRTGVDGKARKQPTKAKAKLTSEMPTAEEAEESYQQTLLDQALRLLECMTDQTRKEFFRRVSGQVWTCHDCGCIGPKSCGCQNANAYSESAAESNACDAEASAEAMKAAHAELADH